MYRFFRAPAVESAKKRSAAVLPSVGAVYKRSAAVAPSGSDWKVARPVNLSRILMLPIRRGAAQ